MLSLKTIDIAIGVALLYLLLTFAAGALVELVSSLANWRAKILHDAIGNMLQNSPLASVDEIYANPQVLALCRNDAAPSRADLMEPFGWRPANGGTPPSYIPSATFSGAVLDTIMTRARSEFELSPEGVVGLIRGLVSAPAQPSNTSGAEDALQSVLRTTLATQGTSIQAVRFAIEKWFNDTMDRAGGWYKRRTQSCLLLIGIAVAFGGNVSTIAVARWLWQSDAARQAMVTAAAEQIAKGAPRADQTSLAPQQTGKTGESTQPRALSPAFTAREIVDLDKKIVDLQYPIGWKASYLGESFWFPEYIIGALITAIAISMGSAFWFDALQNLIKLRGTGPKPGAR
jgi:hypothetical protein